MTITQKGLKELTRFFAKAPKMAGKITASTLNTQAFSDKKNSQRVLGQTLVIRNPRFMASSNRVQMARRTSSPNMMFAISGSIERPRFSGWEEQQTGKPSESNRSKTPAARRGNFQNVMFGKARLKPSTNPITIRDIKKGNRAQRTFELLRRSKKTRRSFIVTRRDQMKVRIKKRWQPGLYGFEGGNLRRYQRFGKPETPKRTNWKGKALKMTMRDNEFFETFKNEWERELKKRGAR